MEFRNLLDKIDFEQGLLYLDGEAFHLKDSYFPTIDKNNPFQLTPAEESLVEKLLTSFVESPKMSKHLQVMLQKGSMYLV